MRILYHHRTQGGRVESVHVQGIVNGLRELGHAVRVVGPLGPPDDGQVDGVRGAGRGGSVGPVRSAAVPTSPRASRPAPGAALRQLASGLPQSAFEAMEVVYNGPAYARLLRSAREWEADVIYERSAAFCIAGALVSRQMGIPLVVEFNDVVGRVGVRQQRFLWLARELEGALLRAAAAAVPVTSYLRQQLQARGMDPGRIVVIGNGFDPERFHPGLDGRDVRQRYGVSDREYLVGFAGGMAPWYRLPDVVQAFASRFAHTPRVRMLLVGDGPDREAVEQKIRELNRTEQILLGPHVPHEAVPAHLAAFDVALIPHCNEHGSPVKLFEYLGAARPLVAVRTAGVTDIVAHEREALLSDPGDLYTLMRQVAWCAENPEAAKALGQRGHSLVLSRYTWRRRAEQTFDVLEESLGGQSHAVGGELASLRGPVSADR